MDPTIFLKYFTFFFTFANIFYHSTATSRIEPDPYLDSNIALKRRQTSGLFPFPRVGRSDSIRFFDMDQKQNKFFSDTEQMKRREGLIPFPRVGKRSQEKANEISISWFGPRLGRDYRHSDTDLEDQYILSLLQDYQLAEVNREDKSKMNSNHIAYVFQDDAKNRNIEYPSTD